VMDTEGPEFSLSFPLFPMSLEKIIKSKASDFLCDFV
jgi:hypothetical protein